MKFRGLVLYADVAMVTVMLQTNIDMALRTVHTIPVEQKFQSTFFSRAVLFAISCNLLTVILPLVIAYSSNGFWIKHTVLYEQPRVQFKHQALFIANGPESSITWSTYEKYNSLVADSIRFPTVVSDEFDVNDDGTPDGLNIELHFDDSEGAQSVQLILIFSYQLKVTDKQRIIFEGAYSNLFNRKFQRLLWNRWQFCITIQVYH